MKTVELSTICVYHIAIVGIIEGDSVKTITADFHNAVNEYLDYCEENDIQPEKPFKGSFNVRIGSELHRKAALQAFERGISLNAYVVDALRQFVGQG